jgi:predicted O-linked N-acetylglucosamine transferase (SPINDLY family)
VKAMMCDWRDRDEEFARLMGIVEKQLAEGQRSALTSFGALARPLSPAMHLAIGRSWAEETKRIMARSRDRLDFTFDRNRRHERLRVAYISQDFRNQAMGHLTRSMYGLHDRREFEIFGYAVRQTNPGIYRKAIQEGCEHFIDIDKVTASEAAERIFADEIDILVDLMGFTEGHRQTILALHPAPVQVGFLRYPGTSGADYLEYMLTDPVVTTIEDQPHYSETLVFLPHCYQPNDWKQEISQEPMTRAEQGLPEDKFVFCCFNNHYKLEPFIFDVWMRILHKVPDSVLWLMRTSAEIEGNIRREAEARGIPAERIIFARKAPKDKHLARQRLADLYIDTRYYTSHTTGSDALWGGLPVLTCPGDTFAARVTASLLRAAELPELIVPNWEEYERFAVHLATHPEDLKRIREKWLAQRTTCPLFDTPRFVRNLERAFRLMWSDYAAGVPRRPLFVVED